MFNQKHIKKQSSAKLLSILANRKQYNCIYQSRKNKDKSDWPTSSKPTLINQSTHFIKYLEKQSKENQPQNHINMNRLLHRNNCIQEPAKFSTITTMAFSPNIKHGIQYKSTQISKTLHFNQTQAQLIMFDVEKNKRQTITPSSVCQQSLSTPLVQQKNNQFLKQRESGIRQSTKQDQSICHEKLNHKYMTTKSSNRNSQQFKKYIQTISNYQQKQQKINKSRPSTHKPTLGHKLKTQNNNILNILNILTNQYKNSNKLYKNNFNNRKQLKTAKLERKNIYSLFNQYQSLNNQENTPNNQLIQSNFQKNPFKLTSIKNQIKQKLMNQTKSMQINENEDINENKTRKQNWINPMRTQISFQKQSIHTSMHSKHKYTLRLKDYETNFQQYKVMSEYIDQKLKWQPKRTRPKSSLILHKKY